MEAKTIIAKVYAGAFYGIEASEIAARYVIDLTVVVIDVFRSKNNMHVADCFFATYLNDGKDFDPQSQILCRRAMQARRSLCKRSGASERYQSIMAKYVRKGINQTPK